MADAASRPSSLPRALSRHRMLAAVLAPVLALVAFSAYVIQEKLDSYRKSTDLLVAAQVARSAHVLARHIENERGLSALYVGTGRTSWRPEVEHQRNVTDDQVTEFRAVLSSPTARALLRAPQMPPLDGRLDAARAAVDGDGDLRTVIEGYSGIVSTLIASSANLTAQDLSNLIAAYMDLGNIKDRLARARAIGSTWLLQGQSDPQLLIMFASARAEQLAFEESFRGHASPAQLRIYDEIVSGPIIEEIRRLHDHAQTGKLQAADADIWHRSHIALFDLITRAEERLALEMEREIQAHLSEAKATFYVVILVVVVLVLFSIETLRRSERRATLAEEEARKLFRAVEQSPVAVMITDPAGLIEYVNPAFTRMTGFERPEVVGRNPRILRSDHTPRQVYTDLWHTVAAGQEWRSELINRRKDGTDYWEKLTIAPVKGSDGQVINYIALKEDVDELHSLREALQREHDNLRRILDATHDGIALIGPDGRFQYANPALVADFGAIEDRTCTEYFGALGDACPSCAPGAETDMRREWRSEANGKTYELTGSPVASPDGGRSFLHVFHDITVRKQAEQALESAREAAELANRAKSEFLSTMSHELRTPLNAIIGFSEIIEGELLGPVGQPQYADYAHDINESGRHLLQLINDILDVARIEVGRIALRESELEPAALVRSALNMVRERADANAVTLSARLPDTLPGLWADERRVKQILVNLLGNAVKFTPSGGLAEVVVTVGPEGTLDFAVRDTGIGIRAEDLAKIMAPFGQADSSLARRFGGSGLGLPLSRQLMDLHGGTLVIDSEPSLGTTVTLRFPPSRVRPRLPA